MVWTQLLIAIPCRLGQLTQDNSGIDLRCDQTQPVYISNVLGPQQPVCAFDQLLELVRGRQLFFITRKPQSFSSSPIIECLIRIGLKRLMKRSCVDVVLLLEPRITLIEESSYNNLWTRSAKCPMSQSRISHS